MSRKHRLFINGYMGSGKSYCSGLLAQHLDLPCIDLDDEIEKYCGRSIHSIFQEDGEIKFRALETEVLEKTVAENSSFVMACGGGTRISERNRELMKHSGITIHLSPDILTIYKRLLVNRSARPIIANLDDDSLFDFISKHREARKPYYESCDLTVEAEEITEIISQIEDFLSRFKEF